MNNNFSVVILKKDDSEAMFEECALMLQSQMDHINIDNGKQRILTALAVGVENSQINKVFVIKNGETPIGIISSNLGISIEKGGLYLWINEFHIKEDERRKGAGKTLFTYVVEWCKKNDIRGISLATSVDNGAAIKFYDNFDFKNYKCFLYDMVF